MTFILISVFSFIFPDKSYYLAFCGYAASNAPVRMAVPDNMRILRVIVPEHLRMFLSVLAAT